jgi:hypothetical protein
VIDQLVLFFVCLWNKISFPGAIGHWGLEWTGTSRKALLEPQTTLECEGVDRRRTRLKMGLMVGAGYDRSGTMLPRATERNGRRIVTCQVKPFVVTSAVPSMKPNVDPSVFCEEHILLASTITGAGQLPRCTSSTAAVHARGLSSFSLTAVACLSLFFITPAFTDLASTIVAPQRCRLCIILKRGERRLGLRPDCNLLQPCRCGN